MKILEFPVRHYQFTVVLFVMLAALGITSWRSIPRAEDPTLKMPTFTVVAVLPGASPSDLERLVVRPVEERIHGLDKVKTLNSMVHDGVATTMVEFEASQDPDTKYEEVLREMNALRPELPAELVRFTVEKATTLDVAIAEVALVSETAPYRLLDSLADDLEDRVGALPGVRHVEYWGAPDPRVNVNLDLGRLSRMSLPPGLVLQAIAGESNDVPAGAVEAGNRRFNVRASGSYEQLSQIRRTVVRSAGGQLVRVGDVADVRWGYADSTYRARYNGKRAVLVTVTQQEGQRIGDVRDRVWHELDAFERTLPAGVTLERGFDQAKNVSHRLSHLGEDFLIAIALVLLTLMPLGLRAAGIVMLSIPLSLAIGISLLYFTGFTINQLSIVGAVIALGLLVDDSIVVVENITRFLRAGHTRLQAAIEATRQIAVAVVGATSTLVFAFVPLLFLPGGPGMYIRSLPLAVIYTVMASFFVSLTIIPWLASLVLSTREKEGNRVLQAFEGAIHRTYAPFLDLALRRPRATLLAAGAFVAVVVALIPVVGFSLFPKAETPQFYVNVTAPEGASLATTDSAARYAERILLARPEVKAVFTSVGHDNPRVYYNIIPRRDNAAVGQLFVVIDRYDHERTPGLLDSLRTALGRYAGAKLELREFENGPPIDAPIAMRIQGPDLDTLQALADTVETIVAGTPGTRYVTNPVRVRGTELRVDIDRGKAGLLGIPTAEIDRTLRMGLEGITAGVLREPSGDARDVVVRLAGGERRSPSTLDHVYVASASTGAMAPLRQVADVHFEADVPEIQRVDRKRTVTVSSFVRTGYNTDRVTRDVLGRLASVRLPEGYRIVPAGEIQSREESFSGIGGAIIVAVFMILGILVLEFGTFRSMLIVASVIPLGVMGGILTLFLVGDTLSFTAMIGFVALVGIEIKTSILLVDFTNQLRKQGVGLEEAIRKAGEVRFLPILLTAMTAIGGLLPLAIQGESLYAPLAWVIIGGLVTSTLLGRVVTPVLYKLLPPNVEARA